jgi:hypothetical protein
MMIGSTQAGISLDARREMSLAEASGGEVQRLSGWRDDFPALRSARTIGRRGLARVTAIESGPAEARQPQAQPRQPGRFRRWVLRVWNWLVEAGEARVRARIGRGIYHF